MEPKQSKTAGEAFFKKLALRCLGNGLLDDGVRDTTRPGRRDRFCQLTHQFIIEDESYRKRTAPGSTIAARKGNC